NRHSCECWLQAERGGRCWPPQSSAHVWTKRLLFVLDLFVLGVDDVAIVFFLPARALRLLAARSAARLLLLCLLLSIHLFSKLVRRLGELLRRGFDLLLVVGLH